MSEAPPRVGGEGVVPLPSGDLTDLPIIVIPPVTSLVSAVVGFHDGSSTRGRD